ncbi:(2Fe-2S)-binding protein [Roseomonas marmotae]|uniref:(2Fe-2S)-binding protein n=1 Tax=Roseomonas marmotae TaxID=2768161 RepID=A0ABS3KC75_9PROT|nr:(2Fe-2S)-binding protein [Roseomonas marmotae]MBO1073941.1 (2Fe-2S)-binding protein [Roseomonas marmotae]QTI78447.1 (2Fe-2S)-binding protein [Roseomonas marmotae]
MKLARLRDTDRAPLRLNLEGQEISALEGDTLLTALLAGGAGHLRESEFGDGHRAGFCLMGACQDCWVSVEGLGRVRACATLARDGMRVRRG